MRDILCIRMVEGLLVWLNVNSKKIALAAIDHL
jgi:hypothetical protein